MNTITIEKKVTTIQMETIELQLPAYFKNVDYNYFYKVASENDVFEINLFERGAQIYKRFGSAKDVANYTQITEAEFNEAVELAKEKQIEIIGQIYADAPLMDLELEATNK